MDSAGISLAQWHLPTAPHWRGSQAGSHIPFPPGHTNHSNHFPLLHAISNHQCPISMDARAESSLGRQGLLIHLR